jgi:hypothetical protein
MNISDILDRPVVDDSGRALGRIHDVRLVQRRTADGHVELRVTGVVFGRGSWGVRLGYGSAEERGPWLLRAILGRMAMRARYAPWESIRVGDDAVVVTGDVARLKRPAQIEEGTP